MTAKSTARKARGPSPAELKRQAAAEKAKADQALAAVRELTGIVSGLAKKIDELSQTPTEAIARAQHDRNAAVINHVLQEAEDTTGRPEKHETHLPDHLVKALRAFEARSAKNNPVSIRDGVETDDQAIGQFEPRELRSYGPAEDSLDPLRAVDDAVVLENRRYSKEKLEYELFLQELVLVRLQDTTDETQIPVPQVVNGGQIQFFVRGREQWVKRLALEPLARAKKTTYSQKKVRLEDGTESYIMVPHTALMYPFVVLEDTPKGKNWLKGILAEPY